MVGNAIDIFKTRKLAIATMHHKEKVIGPKVASRLGVLPFVPSGLDTDQLGTFTGEISRELDALSTARQKCVLALARSGADLAIASEGSFGTYPYFPVTVNEEIVMLVDTKNNLEIAGRNLSFNTNFDGQLCKTWNELLDFAERVGFPQHGLILRDEQNSVKKIFKGVCDQDELENNFQVMLSTFGHAFVETDMRASFNPTRMDVIALATDNLLEKLMVSCEKCNTPGFGLSDVIRGLRCRLCGFPTHSVAIYIHACSKCGFTKEQPNPNMLYEEPMFCDHCNP